VADAPPPAAPPTTAPVPVVDRDGSLLYVPEQDAPQAFAAGARPAEPEEIRDAEAQAESAKIAAKYSSPGAAAFGSLAADTAGFTRGLGQGLGVPTDKVVIDTSRALFGEKGAENARERMSEWETLHPWQTKRSELLGAVAPAVLTPSAGVAGAGEAAEEGAAGLLGSGAKSLAGKAFVRGVRGATEGASYMGTDAVNEAALGDHELTGERLFASMAKGAVFGGALSAGGGVLGDAGTSAWKGTGRLLTKSLGGEGESTITEALMKQRGEIAFRAAGGTKAMAKEANRFAGGADVVGNIWADEAPELVGKKSFGDLEHADLVEAAEKGQEKYGKLLDEHLNQLDAAAKRAEQEWSKGGALDETVAAPMARPPELQPKVADLLGEFQQQVIDPLKGHGATGAQVSKLQSFANDIARITGLEKNPDAVMSFRQMRDFRVDADKAWKTKYSDPDMGAFLGARNFFEDKLMQSGDKLAPELGAHFSEGYQASKRGYQAFALLEKNAESGEAAIARNRILGLTDNIVASGAAKVGGMIGSAAGPLGTAAGAAIGGAAGAIANKMVRSRFNFVAPDVLEHAAALFKVEKRGALVDRQMAEGVSGFFEKPKARAVLPASVDILRPQRGETRAAAHARVAAEISRLAGDPAEQARRFTAETGDMGAHAPKITAATAAVQARASQFLASKLPPGHIDQKSLTPHLDKPRISDAERTQFARYLATIDDPTTVLTDMKAGRLTRDQVEALKAVYPKMYDDLRTKVVHQLAEQEEPLPYAKRIQLGTLFDLPTDETMDPAFVRAIQATYGPAPASDEANAPHPMSPSKPFDVAHDVMTVSQQAEKGM